MHYFYHRIFKICKSGSVPETPLMFAHEISSHKKIFVKQPAAVWEKQVLSNHFWSLVFPVPKVTLQISNIVNKICFTGYAFAYTPVPVQHLQSCF